MHGEEIKTLFISCGIIPENFRYWDKGCYKNLNDDPLPYHYVFLPLFKPSRRGHFFCGLKKNVSVLFFFISCPSGVTFFAGSKKVTNEKSLALQQIAAQPYHISFASTSADFHQIQCFSRRPC